jgi:hypothetical protein
VEQEPCNDELDPEERSEAIEEEPTAEDDEVKTFKKALQKRHHEILMGTGDQGRQTPTEYRYVCTTGTNIHQRPRRERGAD